MQSNASFLPAWKLKVRTHIDFNENEFLEIMIGFEDEFAKNCLEYFEVFQVLSSMSLSKLQNIKLK